MVIEDEDEDEDDFDLLTELVALTGFAETALASWSAVASPPSVASAAKEGLRDTAFK